MLQIHQSNANHWPVYSDIKNHVSLIHSLFFYSKYCPNETPPRSCSTPLTAKHGEDQWKSDTTLYTLQVILLKWNCLNFMLNRKGVTCNSICMKFPFSVYWRKSTVYSEQHFSVFGKTCLTLHKRIMFIYNYKLATC